MQTKRYIYSSVAQYNKVASGANGKQLYRPLFSVCRYLEVLRANWALYSDKESGRWRTCCSVHEERL